MIGETLTRAPDYRCVIVGSKTERRALCKKCGAIFIITRTGYGAKTLCDECYRIRTGVTQVRPELVESDSDGYRYRDDTCELDFFEPEAAREHFAKFHESKTVARDPEFASHSGKAAPAPRRDNDTFQITDRNGTPGYVDRPGTGLELIAKAGKTPAAIGIAIEQELRFGDLTEWWNKTCRKGQPVGKERWKQSRQEEADFDGNGSSATTTTTTTTTTMNHDDNNEPEHGVL